MLEKYVTVQSKTGKDGEDLIPLESLAAIMTDFGLINGLIFMLYDQYMKGEVHRKNEPRAIQKFHDYVESILIAQGGDGQLMRESVDQSSKQRAKQQNNTAVQHSQLLFSRDFFIYHIDKFFKKELSVVLQPLDDEYSKFLASQKKEQDDFERHIEDLDDYFLNDNDMQKP